MTVRVKDITGLTFGSLTAVEFHETDCSGTARWKYKCKCGTVHIARANTITYVARSKNDPELPSCGCVELARKTKHGFRKAKYTHPLYNVLKGMLSRCTDSNTPGYKWYGALGVTVWEGWVKNPAAFIEWGLQNGWKPGLHIDKDILCEEKNIHPHVYSPDTCQWVSSKVNVGFATNRKNFGKHPNVRLSQESVDELLNKYFSGEVTNKSELARMYGLQSSSSVIRIIKLAGGSN